MKNICKKQIIFVILYSVFLFKAIFRDSNPVMAESAGKIPYRITMVSSQVRVDAYLDEEIWLQALKVEPNYEVHPGENIPAPVKTEVLLAYNQTHLFAAFKCHDPDPSKIRAHITDRDNIWNDDWVLLLIDTFNDQRRSYDFFCNPFGIQADMIESSTGGDTSWDVIWNSAGRITEQGYIVEMAIPFRTIQFQPGDGEQIWGFDTVRRYPRSVRHHIGLFPRDRDNNCYMCQAEKLVGFAEVIPGKNIELDPTVSALTTQERENDTKGPFVESKRSLEPGITAHWGFTPNLILKATLNPDFSNVEADAIEMDINRQFAIYYPERRPFFTEGADFFRTSMSIVYTRAMADPRWGIKLTGKEGANTIGFFSAQDEMTNFLFPGSEGSDNESLKMKNQSSVVRYRRDVGKSSNLGMLITDREGDEYHNRVGGFDGIIKFTKKDQIRFQVIKSSTKYPEQILNEFDQPSGDLSGTAFNIFYYHDTKNFNVYGRYREVSPDFRADLGFMSRADYRYSEIGGTIKWRKDPGHWYTWLSIFGSYDLRRDYNYNLLHRAYTSQFAYQGPLQSYLGCYGEYGTDRYHGKDFRMNFLNYWGGLRPSGSLRLGISGRVGDQIDYDNTRPGNRFSIEPSIEYKFGRHLTIEYGHDFERLNVELGCLYTAHINRFKMIYQFNRRTFLRAIIQSVHYNRNTDRYIDNEDLEPNETTLLSQILFSYKINPQTVLYIGYSDNYYGDKDIRLRQTNRTFFTKLGYAWVL